MKKIKTKIKINKNVFLTLLSFYTILIVFISCIAYKSFYVEKIETIMSENFAAQILSMNDIESKMLEKQNDISESIFSEDEKYLLTEEQLLELKIRENKRNLDFEEMEVLIYELKNKIDSKNSLKASNFIFEKNIKRRAYGSRSYQNNNPGNLRCANQIGMVWCDGMNYAIFGNYNDGKMAHIRQIQLDAGRKLTLQEFVYKFAPPTENNTQNYVNYILNRFPWATKYTKISRFDVNDLQKVMQLKEGWFEPALENLPKKIEITNSPEKEQRKLVLQLKISGCDDIEDAIKRVKCMREHKRIKN